MDPIQKKAADAKSHRPVYSYTIPKKLANGVTSVGLVELTSSEELMATKRSGGDSYRLAYELAKQSLAEVNGQAVGLADGTSDSAFESMGPKVRNLVLTAYAKLHAPDEDVTSGFLESQTLRVE